MAKYWMLDELAHAGAGPEHLDSGFVAGYDRKQGLPRLLRRHRRAPRGGLGQAGTVVDLGAGTGRSALAAAVHAHRVVAVDFSPAMPCRTTGRSLPWRLSGVPQRPTRPHRSPAPPRRRRIRRLGSVGISTTSSGRSPEGTGHRRQLSVDFAKVEAAPNRCPLIGGQGAAGTRNAAQRRRRSECPGRHPRLRHDITQELLGALTRAYQEGVSGNEHEA
jgi:hypothetical protein